MTRLPLMPEYGTGEFSDERGKPVELGIRIVSG